MDNEMKRLEGAVASILSSTELVINIGSNKGVKRGMKFAVLARTQLDVPDPYTGKRLDSLDREKIRVEAAEVRDNVTICRTYRVKAIPAGPLLRTSLADLYRPASEVKETLSVERESLPPPLPEDDAYVKVKDRVVSVTEE